MAPAKAVPVYSYDEGIQKLNTAPLSEIDDLAEKFALGEFDVSRGGHRDEFYKLLSEKVAQIPRVQKTREWASKGAPTLRDSIYGDFIVFEQLVNLYALVSLYNDPPNIFKEKYPRFINAWLVLHQNEIPNGKLGLSGLTSFQVTAITLGKESQTSEDFIRAISNYRNDKAVTNSDYWNFAMEILLITNLRSVDRVSNDVPGYQEEMLKAFLIKNIDALKGDPQKQYEYVALHLNPIIRGGYPFSFKGLDKWFEILLNNKNAKNIVAQNQMLMDFYRQRANWELKITPEQYLNRTLALVANCNTSECKGAKTVTLSSMMQRKRNTGKFDEAAALAKQITTLNLEMNNGDLTSNPLLIYTNDYETQVMRGQYAEAEQTVKKIRAFLSSMDNFPYITPEMYHAMVITYDLPGMELDLRMGRYEDAKKYAEAHLREIDEYSEKSQYLKYNYLELKTKVLSILGRAEMGLGNQDKGNELIKYVQDFNGGGNNFSYLDLESKFWIAFWNKDFTGANQLILKAQDLYTSAINSGVAFPIDAVSNILRGEQEVAKYHIGKNEVDLQIVLEFWKKNAVNFEAIYFVSPFESPEERLKSLRINWVNYELFEKDPMYAAFYAKRYVNLLQELRSNIKASDSGALGSFTGIYKDTLQQMSQTFFAANDYDSASKVLNIIKENELLDFSTSGLRSGIIETYLSYTKEEQEFFKRIKPIEKELLHIHNQAVEARKMDRIDQMKRLSVPFNANIKQIQQALASLRRGVDISSKPIKSEKSTNAKEFLVVQSIVSKDQTIFRITADGVNEEVVIPMPRDKLRLMIYQAYAGLSAPNQDWRPGIDLLSKQIFAPLSEKTKTLGLKRIYFVPDDALTFIPPDFIFNSQINGLEVTNLVSAKTALAKPSKMQSGVDAFAATKGGANFPPLPSARDEATFLSGYKFSKLKQDSVQRAFVDENFTKAALTNSLSNPRDVVHIASHFKASGGTDKDVGLLLGDGSFLSLQDLFASGQSFSGISLLTLSACETGVSLSNLSSQAKTFDGLAGLFAKRGVSQVLATLWKISDSSTADFMKVFYIYKESEGFSTAVALERAKALFSGKNNQEIQLLSAKYPDIFTPTFNARIAKYSHPFYWAGFVLVSSGT